MSRKTKIWLIAAVCLILFGCIMLGGVMTMLNWDFTKLSTHTYETNEYDITDQYSGIFISTNTAEIALIPSADGKTTVTCYEQQRVTHTVTVKDGALYIDVVDERKWHDYIGIHFGSPKITVSLPAGQYDTLTLRTDTGAIDIPHGFQFEKMTVTQQTGSFTCRASTVGTMNIQTSTGVIRIENITADTLKLSISTGKTYLENIACRTLESSGNTGGIIMKNVIAAEQLTVSRSTGDVRLEGCDAGNLSITTATGEVSGSLLTEKTFITYSTTGRIDVPKTTAGGECRITTSTGNIKITIP